MHVYLSDHTLVISAQTVCIGRSARPAAVLLFSRSGRPFSVSMEEQNLAFSGCAALVAPHVARRLHAVDCGLTSINFEPGHPYYRPLMEAVGRHSLVALHGDWARPFHGDFEGLQEGHGRCADLSELLHEVARCLTGRQVKRHTDGRIAEALLAIEEHISSPPSLDVLAASARISPTRFSHLFVEQVGLSLRSYVLWRRYRKALVSIHRGGSLAALAHETGFSDHAQMSRVFSKFFAYQPSRLRGEAVVIHA